MVDVNNSLDIKNTGVVVNNGAGGFLGRTLTAGSTKIAITNGSGVAANPTIDATEANFDINNLGGSPLTVPHGGTGLTTITDHGVMIGSGVTAVTPITVGATGELLTGVTGADPAFATISSGDFTFTNAAANTARRLSVTNSGTGATSNANLLVGSDNGDPQILMTSGINDWTIQLDQSDSASFKLHHGSGTAGPQIMRVDNATSNTNWNYQSRFLANLINNLVNVTGDGTYYLVKFDNSFYDVGSPYNPATGYFTAPIAGTYLFNVGITFENITNQTGGNVVLITTTQNYNLYVGNPQNMKMYSNHLTVCGTALAKMSVGDTAQVTVWIYNGGSPKTVSINGASAPAAYGSFFQGYLLG
jgi:hypothetical protein